MTVGLLDGAKALDTFGNCQSILTWFYPNKRHNEKSVTLWTQLVFEVTREKNERKTLHYFLCFSDA